MPTKKRKYEARFPPARIKKIMQTDEEIGKVAAAVPVIISRALEIFLQQLVEKSAEQTRLKRAKTMTTGHLKQCIESENQFDFLKDQVANIADMPNQEEDDHLDSGETKPKKPRKQRAQSEKKKQSRRRAKSSSSNDSEDEYNVSDDNEEPTTVYPRTSRERASSNDSSNSNHTQQDATVVNRQVSTSAPQISQGFENQPNPFDTQAPSIRPLPMMFKADEDDEDYDEEDD
eukprot:gene20611-22645_t